VAVVSPQKFEHMSAASPKLVFALLIALAYTLATCAHLRALSQPDVGTSDGAFKKLLGDGRRLFAGQFVEMADVYFHSGFYPSIFDRRDTKAPLAVTGKTGVHDDHDEPDHAGHQHDENGKCVEVADHQEHQHDAEGRCLSGAEHQDEHEKAMDKGEARDWLESFIRRFRITEHTHLENGGEREILPWLKLAIELDPQAIGTYTTTAYWLRKNLDKPKDAEEVLREGLRNNPRNCEILFELGLIYRENYKEVERARNVWRSALRLWDKQSDEAKSESLRLYGEITGNLARLEADAGNWSRAIQYFELAKLASPHPEAIQKQIDEIKSKQGAPAP
jgi:tetratricopeptide (TPR) repeat protein